MSSTRLNIMYGHLEGNAGKFARDPSGYLSIEAGIFDKHGLEISWDYVQGTEERHRRLNDGRAHVSLVVGRASLQHFLAAKASKILGCAMNSCPYYLLVEPSITQLTDLKGKTVACREAPSRSAPIARTLEEKTRLRLGEDATLRLPDSDQEAYQLLINGQVHAALLPRPFGFWAEEKGFKRIADWPDVVDDPLPITLETTDKLFREREGDLTRFLHAQREAIGYLKTNRQRTIQMLIAKFGHSAWFAARTFDDYLVCMDESLRVDFKQLEKLLSQVAPGTAAGARQLASRWIAPGALRD